jgi:hypothetical protein
MSAVSMRTTARMPKCQPPFTLGLVGGVVRAAAYLRVHTLFPNLPDHQNPGKRLGCHLGAVENAVFIHTCR